MATTITSTVGTGGTYTTLAAWFAAAPASLVTADQIWRAEMLNQEFSSATTALNMTGKTVDSTRYFEVTTVAGASFRDHANKSTNPLRYDGTKGAALKVTSNSTVALTVNQQYTRISNLQFLSSSTGANACPPLSVTSDFCSVDNCIIEATSLNASIPGALVMAGGWLRNTVVIQLRNDATAVIAKLTGGVKATNVTLVSLGGTPLTYGIITQYIANVFKNVYVGGVVAPENGTIAATKTNCYSNATATGYSVAPQSTATFQNVTAGTHDLRLAAGSTLINVGVTDTTNAATDILGTARPQGAAYDVGAWELPVGGDTTAPVLEVPTATATGPTTATGGVATDEAGGLLYRMASTNPTETAAAIRAANLTSSVEATGAQVVLFTGLPDSTLLYAHYVQVDEASNESLAVHSAEFTTHAPTVTIDALVGAAAAEGSLATVYQGTTVNGTPGGATADGNTGSVTTAGTTTISASIGAALADGAVAALFQGVTILAFAGEATAAGNNGTVTNNGATTISGLVGAAAAAGASASVSNIAGGSFLTDVLTYNSGAGGIHANQAAVWTWFPGGRLGSMSAVTSIDGTGTTSAEGRLTAAGIPPGAGILMIAIRKASVALDDVYLETGTVA